MHHQSLHTASFRECASGVRPCLVPTLEAARRSGHHAMLSGTHASLRGLGVTVPTHAATELEKHLNT